MQRVANLTLRGGMALRDAIFPLTCLMCDARVEAPGLCPECWRETPFVSDPACDLCGTPLPGTETAEGGRCDECLTVPRPWEAGRAALVYAGRARALVLQLKHADRTELAQAAALWLHRRARDRLTPDTVIVPVPLHRWRLFRRRYNQSAEIARALAARTGGPCLPQGLLRTRATLSQDHRSRPDRFENIRGAIAPAPGLDLNGAPVALVDDVMTSGATMAACADVLRAARAGPITALMLARVAKDR
ncbi:ComF family protein [Jannaschia aquimarina]|nr:ComF family protein [Jannaschia aquimarina]